MSVPPRAYRLASTALAPAFAGYTVARSLRDGGRRYARERSGRIAPRADRPLWLHCASVGEVVAALPLLTELDAHGIGPLLLSTNTPTGCAVATARVPTGVDCVYLPLDRPAPVRRFLTRAGPRAGIVLETELWPWLYAGAAERDIPIALVNARLSNRTRRAPAWLRDAAAFCLQRVEAVLARSADDAAAFVALGAPAERVRTIGNLKLAAPPALADAEVTLGRAYVLAASTHEDEEAQLARAWQASGPDEHLLVVAPRHPERGAGIADQLRGQGLRVARRSRSEPATPATDVYLADTLGELPALIAGAELVIMGGSLIPRGGQNVLEPARAGRAILTGPNMDNFREETAALAAAGGLRQCADAAAVVAAAGELLADPGARAAMGRRAASVLAAGADIAARYHTVLAEILGEALQPTAGRCDTGLANAPDRVPRQNERVRP